MKSAEGNVTVVLTDGTTTKDDKGLFGLEKQQMSNVVLIPGLKVDVDGTSDEQGRVVARTITVDGDDLETAEMIQAGLHPTAEQVAANMRAIETNRAGYRGQQGATRGPQGKYRNQPAEYRANRQQIDKTSRNIEENTNRFTALSEYDVKGEATVKFDVGSSEISAEDQEELKTLAQTATGLKGYIIEVTGYADSTGNAAINTKLSEDRAKAVITYLIQQGNVPMRHIVAPGAMGEYGAAASNETRPDGPRTVGLKLKSWSTRASPGSQGQSSKKEIKEAHTPPSSRKAARGSQFRYSNQVDNAIDDWQHANHWPDATERQILAEDISLKRALLSRVCTTRFPRIADRDERAAGTDLCGRAVGQRKPASGLRV